MRPVAIAVAAVIIIVLVWLFMPSGNRMDTFVSGCWIAPDDFCQSAEIDSMMIVLDDLSTEGTLWKSQHRLGYIVILPNAVSSPMHVEYSSVKNTSAYTQEIVANVKFDDGPDWGDAVKIKADALRGSMEISGMRDGTEIVYARLYRQNDISEMAKHNLADDSAPIS